MRREMHNWRLTAICHQKEMKMWMVWYATWHNHQRIPYLYRDRKRSMVVVDKTLTIKKKQCVTRLNLESQTQQFLRVREDGERGEKQNRLLAAIYHQKEIELSIVWHSVIDSTITIAHVPKVDIASFKKLILANNKSQSNKIFFIHQFFIIL